MKIGLCLGGGGARGFAHIGVLKALAERDLEPSAIGGCSMGGLIGGLVATGLEAGEIAERLRGIPPRTVMDFSRAGGLLGHKGVDRQLARLIPETFEELKIPLAVTTVDVQSGRLVVLRSGPLLPALRATSAIPGVFSPVQHEGHILIDGGLLNNVPVDVVNVLTLDPIIAVDVGAPPDRKLVIKDQRGFLEKVKRPTSPGHRPLIIDLMVKAFDIPTAMITELRLAAHRPEVIIRPNLDPNLKLEDFDRLDDAIHAGYSSAIAALDEGMDRLMHR